MSASSSRKRLHRVYLCLGSNIAPEQNIRAAVALLREYARVTALSTCWETRAVGSQGPNFLNLAACLETALGADALKERVIAGIELRLGRVRSQDKNAPRTIDIDPIVEDGLVLDEHLWQHAYIAVPFAELLPALRNPRSGETLRQAAERLRRDAVVLPHPELVF